MGLGEKNVSFLKGLVSITAPCSFWCFKVFTEIRTEQGMVSWNKPKCSQETDPFSWMWLNKLHLRTISFMVFDSAQIVLLPWRERETESSKERQQTNRLKTKRKIPKRFRNRYAAMRTENYKLVNIHVNNAVFKISQKILFANIYEGRKYINQVCLQLKDTHN